MNRSTLQGGALIGEGAGKQVAVVRLVQAKGVLHDLGDVAELVSDQPVAIGDGVVNVDLLDLEGGVGVQAGQVSVGASMGWPCCRAVRRVPAMSSSVMVDMEVLSNGRWNSGPGRMC